jgi:hypothetical protein
LPRWLRTDRRQPVRRIQRQSIPSLLCSSSESRQDRRHRPVDWGE